MDPSVRCALFSSSRHYVEMISAHVSVSHWLEKVSYHDLAKSVILSYNACLEEKERLEGKDLAFMVECVKKTMSWFFGPTIVIRFVEFQHLIEFCWRENKIWLFTMFEFFDLDLSGISIFTRLAFSSIEGNYVTRQRCRLSCRIELHKRELDLRYIYSYSHNTENSNSIKSRPEGWYHPRLSPDEQRDLDICSVISKVIFNTPYDISGSITKKDLCKKYPFFGNVNEQVKKIKKGIPFNSDVLILYSNMKFPERSVLIEPCTFVPCFCLEKIDPSLFKLSVSPILRQCELASLGFIERREEDVDYLQITDRPGQVHVLMSPWIRQEEGDRVDQHEFSSRVVPYIKKVLVGAIACARGVRNYIDASRKWSINEYIFTERKVLELQATKLMGTLKHLLKVRLDMDLEIPDINFKYEFDEKEAVTKMDKFVSILLSYISNLVNSSVQKLFPSIMINSNSCLINYQPPIIPSSLSDSTLLVNFDKVCSEIAARDNIPEDSISCVLGLFIGKSEQHSVYSVTQFLRPKFNKDSSGQWVKEMIEFGQSIRRGDVNWNFFTSEADIIEVMKASLYIYLHHKGPLIKNWNIQFANNYGPCISVYVIPLRVVEDPLFDPRKDEFVMKLLILAVKGGYVVEKRRGVIFGSILDLIESELNPL